MKKPTATAVQLKAKLLFKFKAGPSALGGLLSTDPTTITVTTVSTVGLPGKA
jgi:hypothetical protein